MRNNFSSPLVDEIAITVRAAGREPVASTKIPGSANSYSFDDLDPALTYSVRVEAPGFRTWTRDGVTPGSRVGASLVGNGSIRLSVIDGAGAPVPSYRLSARIHGVSFTPNSSTLLEADQAPPPDGVFQGFVPGDYTLLLETRGRDPLEVAVSGLVPGETRDVVARLQDAGRARIEGVVRAGDGAPLADTAVILYRPALLDDSPESPFFKGWVWSDEDERRFRKEVGRTTTGPEGRFVLSDAATGHAIVRVLPGPGLEVVRELDLLPGDAPWLDVLCGPFSYVVGELLVPPGVSLEGLEVLVGVSEHTQHKSIELWEPDVEAAGSRVRPDGSFRVGPLAIGETCIALVYSATGVERDRGDGLILRDIDFSVDRPGDVGLDFDLRADFWGNLEVALQVDGAPADGYTITLANDVHWAQGTTSGGGASRLVAAGGDYRVRVQPRDRRFEVVLENAVTVPPGGVGRTRVDLALERHELRARCEEDDTAASNAKLLVMTTDRDGRVLQSRVTTDDAGGVQLAYPAGTVLWITPDAQERWPRFWTRELIDDLPAVEWTDVGPVPAVVELCPQGD